MDTRNKREEREKIIKKCLKELAVLYEVAGWETEIEVWSSDDVEPVREGRTGIQITMSWVEI